MSLLDDMKAAGITPGSNTLAPSRGSLLSDMQAAGVAPVEESRDAPRAAADRVRKDIANPSQSVLASLVQQFQPHIDNPQFSEGSLRARAAEKVGKFTGTDILGKALGGAAGFVTGATKQSNEASMRLAESNQKLARLLNDPNASPEAKEHARNILSQNAVSSEDLNAASAQGSDINYTPGQVYGSALQTAALAAGGSSVAGTLGSKAGLATKLGVGALEGAGVGAVTGAGQALTEGKDLAGVGKSALGGAALGGVLGGAVPVAGAVLKGGAKLTGQSYRAIRNVVKPNEVEAFTRGIAPTGTKAANFQKVAKTAIPDVGHAAQDLGLDLTKSDDVFGDSLKAAKHAKQGIWDQVEDILKTNGKVNKAGTRVNGSQIADAMIKGMDRRFIQQNPAAAEALIKKANTYRRNLTIRETEEFLQSANADLSTYYAKNKVGRAAALGDSEVSHVVKEADALRDALYGKLDEISAGAGAEAKNLKQRYGALTEVEDHLLKRQAVNARLKPMSIGETIHYPLAIGKAAVGAFRGDVGGAVSGLAEAGAAKAMKEAQTNEAMLKKAFGAWEKRSAAGSAMEKPSLGARAYDYATDYIKSPKIGMGIEDVTKGGDPKEALIRGIQSHLDLGRSESQGVSDHAIEVGVKLLDSLPEDLTEQQAMDVFKRFQDSTRKGQSFDYANPLGGTRPKAPAAAEGGIKGQKAVEHLMTQKSGEVKAAFHHPDVGNIDLIWGKAGKDGGGLAHIAEKRPDLLPRLEEIISKGKVLTKSANRIRLVAPLDDLGDHLASISLDMHGDPKTWLLTAFKITK